jgi:hypothetical protein
VIPSLFAFTFEVIGNPALATFAASGRAALLMFILPVSLPGAANAIGPRLAGWGSAVAVAVPAAMLVWPPS